ncbi:MAG: hypothetical protein Q4E01_06515 [Actinomycetaceae bacterium]|nr:hypothetical protein [Actinomycetaceae bacterium]
MAPETEPSTGVSSASTLPVGELGDADPVSKVAIFADTVEVSDGISLVVAKPEPIDTAGTSAGVAIKMGIEVENSGEEEFDTSFITVSIISAGEPGTILGYENAGDLTLPQAPVEPGQRMAMNLGATVKDIDDVSVTLLIKGADSATFTNRP